MLLLSFYAFILLLLVFDIFILQLLFSPTIVVFPLLGPTAGEACGTPLRQPDVAEEVPLRRQLPRRREIVAFVPVRWEGAHPGRKLLHPWVAEAVLVGVQGQEREPEIRDLKFKVLLKKDTTQTKRKIISLPGTSLPGPGTSLALLPGGTPRTLLSPAAAPSSSARMLLPTPPGLPARGTRWRSSRRRRTASSRARAQSGSERGPGSSTGRWRRRPLLDRGTPVVDSKLSGFFCFVRSD